MMKHLREELEKICLEEIRESPPDAFHDAIKRIDSGVLLESAGTYGTPQYFLDVDDLKERAAHFARTVRNHIPGSELFYAFKCNDLPLLVGTLKEAGYQADVAGLFELELALRLGFDRILFSGPGKSMGELECALQNRERVTVIADNFDELRMLGDLAGNGKEGPAVHLGFRVGGRPAAGSGAKWAKFGFELDQLPEAARFVDGSPNMDWAGIHFHASWNKTPRAYVENIRRIGGFLERHIPGDRLRRLRFLDIGGGFYPEDQGILFKGMDRGIMLDILRDRGGDERALREMPHFDPYSFVVTEVEPLDTFAVEISRCLGTYIMPLNPAISIYLEPGRFIATHSTTILLKVVAVKRDCVIVDGGINMLGDYKFFEYAFSPIINMTRPSGRLMRRIIYGPLCDPCDLWGYSCYADGLQKGDILAVLHQGAYTFSTAWRFIKPLPPYIAYSGGGYIVAKEAERFSDRYAGCRL
ncbi:MAG TPA: alanine racemase [Patescibacteria group bacterium]|nr:alanine racemase [Patescibacteria group bacterium]